MWYAQAKRGTDRGATPLPPGRASWGQMAVWPHPMEQRCLADPGQAREGLHRAPHSPAPGADNTLHPPAAQQPPDPIPHSLNPLLPVPSHRAGHTDQGRHHTGPDPASDEACVRPTGWPAPSISLQGPSPAQALRHLDGSSSAQSALCQPVSLEATCPQDQRRQVSSSPTLPGGAWCTTMWTARAPQVPCPRRWGPHRGSGQGHQGAALALEVSS